jgi:tetratricopeptide (TPR) repeat protein
MLTRVQSLRGRSACRAFAIVLAGGFLWSAGAAAHDDLRNQIAALTREIASERGNAGLYLRRGELHRLCRDVPAALADYASARRLDPGLAAADLGAGRALVEAKRPADAKRFLERFVRARPDDPEGRLELARALVGLRSTNAADDQYAQAIALAPRPSPDVYFERARFLRAAGRLPAAIRALDDGIARVGPLASLEELAVDLEISRKNYDGALARLDRTFPPTNGRQETRLARRGEILAAAGRSVEARETFQQAQRSIESLPPRLRQTRAIQKLEGRVRSSLESLRVAGPEKEKADAKS